MQARGAPASDVRATSSEYPTSLYVNSQVEEMISAVTLGGVSTSHLDSVSHEETAEPPLAQAIPILGTDTPDQATAAIFHNTTRPLQRYQCDLLREMGYTEGLVQGLDELKQKFPLRFWLVDNSGSMLESDGTEFRGERRVPCTRWAELQGAVSHHVRMAGILQTNTMFRLINEPGIADCPREFSVADPSSSVTIEESVRRAIGIVQRISPHGWTPLTSHLESIRDSLRGVERTLLSRGEQAVVVIATDGMPTDDSGNTTEAARQAFEHSLKEILQLPVWIVIRLCTDDHACVSYYNELDSKLELSMEVIDDYFNEAKQVHDHNPWLNYATPLHRCREMGFSPREFDLLDERKLIKDELLVFVGLLFGRNVFQTAPDIHSDWKAFVEFLQSVLDNQGDLFNPLTLKTAPWIDTRQLNKSYAEGSLKKLRNLLR